MYYYVKITYHLNKDRTTYNIYNLVSMIVIHDIGCTMTDAIQISNHVYRATLDVISNLTSEQTSG